MTAASVKARKGDALLVVRVTHDYIIGEPRRVRTEYAFGVVHSATREGVVKTWQSLGWGDELLSTSGQPLARGQQTYILPRSEFDVPALLTAAKEHHYPGHPGQPMPFTTLDAARECARPHRLEVNA